MSRNPFLKAIAVAYQKCLVAGKGRIGSVDDVLAEARPLIGPVDIDAVVDEALRKALDTHDKSLLDKAKSRQMDLFSGAPEALDGVFADGRGGRVRLRDAEFGDWNAQRKLLRTAAQEALGAADDLDDDFNELVDYLRPVGVTTEQALAAWRRDHPGQTRRRS